MVHHIVLFKLKPEFTPARVEEMMMTRACSCLKIPEPQHQIGKRIDSELPWPFLSQSISSRWINMKFSARIRFR